jgi:hypothetical protein
LRYSTLLVRIVDILAACDAIELPESGGNTLARYPHGGIELE